MEERVAGVAMSVRVVARCIRVIAMSVPVIAVCIPVIARHEAISPCTCLAGTCFARYPRDCFGWNTASQ